MVFKPIEKAGASLARKKAGFHTFKTAYKAAPGDTLGQYAKKHKAGLAFGTALTVAPTPHFARAQQRRSTHTGIDQKGLQ